MRGVEPGGALTTTGALADLTSSTGHPTNTPGALTAMARTRPQAEDSQMFCFSTTSPKLDGTLNIVKEHFLGSRKARSSRPDMMTFHISLRRTENFRLATIARGPPTMRAQGAEFSSAIFVCKTMSHACVAWALIQTLIRTLSQRTCVNLWTNLTSCRLTW